MYKPTLAAIVLSTTLVAGIATAQTTAPVPVPASTGSFVSKQGMSEFKASKFVGVDVYGSEGEKIGDITEILLDQQGAAKAVVIGVGGFLGMGQKTVALPWSALTWSNEPMAPKTAAADRPPTTGSTRPPQSPMGATPPTAAPTRSPAEQAAYNGYPDHAKVSLTKAQLQEAPDFKYVADSSTPSPK